MPANGPTSTGTIMAKIDLRSSGRFAIFGRYEWASVAEPRGSSHPSFYASLCPYIHGVSMARNPTMTLPKVDPTMTLCPYIHGEKTSKAPEQARASWYFVIEGGELQDP